MLDSFTAVQTKKGIDDIKKSFVEAKKPIQELISMCLSCSREAVKALEDTSVKKTAAKASTKAKETTKTSAPKACTIMDVAPDLAKTLETYSVQTATVDVSEPFKVSVRGDSLSTLQAKTSALTVFVTGFNQLWRKRTQRNSDKRAVQRMPKDSPADRALTEFIDAHLPAELLKARSTTDNAELSKSMQPQAFAITQDHIDAQSEKDLTASFRLTMSGSRSVLLFWMDGIIAFMVAKGIKDKLSTKRIYSFISTINKDVLQELLAAGHEVFYTSLAAGDVLYIPATFVVLDKTGNSDVLGCRTGVVFKDATAAEQIDRIIGHIGSSTADAVDCQSMNVLKTAIAAS